MTLKPKCCSRSMWTERFRLISNSPKRNYFGYIRFRCDVPTASGYCARYKHETIEYGKPNVRKRILPIDVSVSGRRRAFNVIFVFFSLKSRRPRDYIEYVCCSQAAAAVGAGYSNNGYRPEQHMSTTAAVSSRLPPYHHREIVTVRTPLMSSQQESCV